MNTDQTPRDAVREGPVVLIVEDNAAMRSLIRQLVHDVTAVVYECADGECALEVYRRARPDWVLMDIDLGGGADGLSVTRAIRSADPTAQVIVVTEHGAEWYRREAKAAGASGFLLKEDLLELPRLLTTPHANTERPVRGQR